MFLWAWDFPGKNTGATLSSVQLLSRVRLFATLWTAAHQASLSFTNSQSSSKSRPSSWWCHPIISSSVVPFSSCLQSFPTSGSFPLSQFFTSAGQGIGASASAMNIQDWSPLGWTGWISLQSKGLSRVFSNTTVQKHQFLVLSLLHGPTITSVHDYWRNIVLTVRTFFSKVAFLLFNMLSRFVITFLPRSKRLLIPWLQSPSHWFWSPRK